MKCPYCGNEIADDCNFCEYCGKKIEHEKVHEVNRASKVSQPKEAKKANPQRKMLICIAVVCLVAVIGVLCGLWYFKSYKYYNSLPLDYYSGSDNPIIVVAVSAVTSNDNEAQPVAEPAAAVDTDRRVKRREVVEYTSKAEVESKASIEKVRKDTHPEKVPIKLEVKNEKCKASDYPQVTIGTQTWMAENYRCSKYDTQSEAYNASWLTNNTVFTSKNEAYTPYYSDATDKSNWNDDSRTKYSINLTIEQIAKLGYLYSWAAAVGVENGQTYTTEFMGNRQGICPNGWHIPTRAEWRILANYVDGNNGKTNSGQKLKTKSGWYSNGNGTDIYGFAALPSGSASGSSVDLVGNYAIFWTATPVKGYDYTWVSSLHIDDQLGDDGSFKYVGRSVRCLRD